MSTYPRLQGKKGKQLKEKRRKQNERKNRKGRGSDIDTSGFMGIDYDDSVYIPENPLGISEDHTTKYSSPALRKYSRIDMDGIENFYAPTEETGGDQQAGNNQECQFWVDCTPDNVTVESDGETYETAGSDNMEVESDGSEDSIIDILSSESEYEPNEMEIESSEYELEDTESESSDLPEPTFLLNRPNFNFEPDYGMYPNLDFANADQKKKEVHKVNKKLADSKLKFVPAAFNILANNDFLHSISFTPFPEKASVRQLIDKLAGKYNMSMHTQKEQGWYLITISKPEGWVRKHGGQKKIKMPGQTQTQGKTKKTGQSQSGKPKKPTGSAKKSPSTTTTTTTTTTTKKKTTTKNTATLTKTMLTPHSTTSTPTSEAKTLMEGLSTPIGSENKGNELLKKMGWMGGALGQHGDGIVEPVGIHIKRDNKGLGASGNDNGKGKGKSQDDGMCFVRSKNE